MSKELNFQVFKEMNLAQAKKLPARAKKRVLRETHVVAEEEDDSDFFLDLGAVAGLPPAKKKPAKVNVDKIYSATIEIDNEAITGSDVEDFEDLRESLKIKRSTERTLVYAVVKAKKEELNVLTAIKCNAGSAFGGYAYDRSRDSCLVDCVEVLYVGQIPFSFFISMNGVGTWQVKVPMPESLLEKHLSPQQRKNLEIYREKWAKDKYKIEFVQMLGCN